MSSATNFFLVKYVKFRNFLFFQLCSQFAFKVNFSLQNALFGVYLQHCDLLNSRYRPFPLSPSVILSHLTEGGLSHTDLLEIPHGNIPLYHITVVVLRLKCILLNMKTEKSPKFIDN